MDFYTSMPREERCTRELPDQGLLTTLVYHMSNEPVITRYEFPSEDFGSALRRVARRTASRMSIGTSGARSTGRRWMCRKQCLESIGVDTSSIEAVDQALREWLSTERLALFRLAW